MIIYAIVCGDDDPVSVGLTPFDAWERATAHMGMTEQDLRKAGYKETHYHLSQPHGWVVAAWKTVD